MMLVLALMDAESVKNMAIGIVLLTACLSTAAVLYPLARAMARRLEGGHREPRPDHQVEDLTERVHQLECQVGQMQEMEERLDFAERLLLESRQPFPERKLTRGKQKDGADTPPEPVDAGR